MCVFQETVAWKSTPRYFVASSVFMMCPISLWEGGYEGGLDLDTLRTLHF